jgi:hypothetical protein
MAAARRPLATIPHIAEQGMKKLLKLRFLDINLLTIPHRKILEYPELTEKQGV